MTQCIRVIDGGGDWLRRAEVYGFAEVTNVKKVRPVENVEQLLDFACGDLPMHTIGISFALAGEIEKHSIVVKSPNIHILDGKSLPTLVMGKTGKPCVVSNDMECAVMGMAALLSEEKYFMGITWSSGIGLRFYKDGKIIASSEGGHVPLDPSPYAPLCGCGVRGCAESILGGHAIRRRVVNETEAQGISIPNGLDPCKFLDQQFKETRLWAMRIYDLISTGMATFLANKITLFRMPTIVWKGSFAKNALPLIETSIRRKMRSKLINPKWANQVKFLFSPNPENDGLIGAAKLFESLHK